jgi:hypothetical protein
VTSVNGKQLDTPVRFADPDVSPVFCREEVQGPAREVGDVWELRGIEIGRYRGIPAKVIEEVFPPRSMVPQMSHTFGFYTQILDSSSRVIRHGQRETTTSPSTTAPPRPASKLPPRDTRDPFELEWSLPTRTAPRAVVGLWAVEIGGFHAIPSEALMETTGGFVKMQQAREFGFTTELLYC